MTPKNTAAYFCHPSSPGTIPQICLCLCVFLSLSICYLAAQSSHRRIATTAVAVSGPRNHSVAEITGFFVHRPQQNRNRAISGASLKIAGNSQLPRPQSPQAAQFCGRSDHGTLRSVIMTVMLFGAGVVHPRDLLCKVVSRLEGQTRSGDVRRASCL